MTMPPLRVLGFDPGFASLGYALVELRDPSGLVRPRVVQMGVLETRPSAKKRKVLAADDNLRRLRVVARAVAGLVSGRPPAEWRSDNPGQTPSLGVSPAHLVCAETMSFPRNSSAAAKMALTWGTIMAEVERWNLPFLQASPQEIKLAVTGRRDAEKKDVEDALVKRYGKNTRKLLRELRDGAHNHAFDALAAITACLDSEEGRMLLRLGR